MSHSVPRELCRLASLHRDRLRPAPDSELHRPAPRSAPRPRRSPHPAIPALLGSSALSAGNRMVRARSSRAARINAWPESRDDNVIHQSNYLRQPTCRPAKNPVKLLEKTLRDAVTQAIKKEPDWPYSSVASRKICEGVLADCPGPKSMGVGQEHQCRAVPAGGYR